MRIRTFTAPTMKKAMALVRAEMGADAIIVYFHERKRGRGVEVRAASESPASPVLPSLPAAAKKSEQALPRPSLAAAVSSSQATHVEKAKAHLSVPLRATRPPNVKTSAPVTARRTNTRAVTTLANLDLIHHTLRFHGLPARLSTALCETAEPLAGDDAARALAKALGARIRFAPLFARPPQPIMLVGGPGVGKTVTTAKLAARAVLAGHKVRVITTDTLRSGAVEQLARLLAHMKLETETADSPQALARWLSLHGGKADMVLFIDTPGTNALAANERGDLARFIAAGALEAVLVHAAGADCEEAAADAQCFAELGVRRTIATRLDTARRLGSVLNVADAVGLAIAEVSLSPYLSEPLHALTPLSLARVLLAQSKAGVTLSRGRPHEQTLERPLQ